MEPYRWLVDLTVMEMFTSSQLDIRDFYFTGDDYRYRFEHDAKLRFIRNLVEHFKKRVSYDRELCSWSTVIQEKTRQLANHISDPARPIDFTEPSPILEKPMEAA
jgi:CRISPR/Cas system-associated endonuclease Cas1